jgi:hypothetical protein
MDLKSILRTFRYTELQAKADRDPTAKRPPTIKFLAVVLFIAVLALGFSYLVMNYHPSTGSGGSALSVHETAPSGNATSSPTTSSGLAMPASAQNAPGPATAATRPQ